MFSSALKSLSSNISSNYSVAQQPSIICGPWKVFDGRKRSGGKAVSIFVFERKSIEPTGGLRGAAAANARQAQDEVLERLKKEASALARLRHPSILELAEPVEETRAGGLTFATEPVTASLAGLLEEQDEQEKAGGVGGRSSKYVVEDPAAGGRRRREVEIDELEIQKGLLQVAKGLEFLHESARLVHANLNPEAIFINAKSDWKISGLGFSMPPSDVNSSSAPQLQLSEILNYDTRLPRSVQLNLDYSSPDLVMDSNVTTAADMFSLGLIVVALYNSPHRTPLDTSHSVSTYRRLLSAPGTTPTPRNNFLSSQPIPKEIISSLLPRLITRRPATRISAREFQQTQYFDSILVSTLRFLDNLPAKTPHEKSQFMRGLPRIMSQFPKSVLEKKVLLALLEEMKDLDLLAQILENVFKIVGMIPNGNRVFSEKIVPRLRQVFLASAAKSKTQERDTSKEGGILIVLENMSLVSTHCTSKEFKEDILPIIFIGLDSPTHSVQDAALNTMPLILPVLDFSTIKNDLFPAVAHVFTKTSSMGIKIKGLEALNILCGGTVQDSSFDETSLMMNTNPETKASSSSTLDKYTVQEKIMPLLKGIKTKEPAVMMAALNVFTQVGKIADANFLALDVIPSLWQFSLGPLLNLEQFQRFMTLIKSLSTRIEEEQTRKLQQLSSAGRASSTANKTTNGGTADEGDFETLVTGRKANANGGLDWDGGWDTGPSSPQAKAPQSKALQNNSMPSFSWSTPQANVSGSNSLAAAGQQLPRTITPDTNIMSSYASLQPTNKSATANPTFQSNNPQSNSQSFASLASRQPSYSSNPSSPPPINWSSFNNSSSASTNPWTTNTNSSILQPQKPASPSSSNPWSSLAQTQSQSQLQQQNPWASPSQPMNLSKSMANMNIAPPPKPSNQGAGSFGQTTKPGLDKYDSLL